MSEYKMTVDVPHLPKGAPIQIVGLGTFENGSTVEVSKEDADHYRDVHGRQEPQHDEDGSLVGMSREKGPTLLQASKSMYGVEVETVQGGSNPPPPPPPPPGDDDDDDPEGDED